MPPAAVPKEPREPDSLMENILHSLKSDHLAGRCGGVPAICSVRREVLEAAIELALSTGGPLLIEATANQVNPYGGYSGMTPAAFAAHIDRLVDAMGFPRHRLVLGADHLGPYAWRDQPAETAMQRALDLVRQCAAAGFQKIHLDTGFGCADDPPADLPLEIAAERAAVLCRAAETASERLAPGASRPLYVIGVEVPPPGGALEDPEALQVTPVAKLQDALRIYAARFRSAGLEAAWERVLAVVVQPGVEFGDDTVARYVSARAAALSRFHARLPGIMTYEVHSTDYQPPACLGQMVADHFTVVKAGPCLTNAFREAVFALARVESEQLGRRRGVALSNIRTVLEAVMLENPVHWQAHYRGPAERRRFLRSHSQRDRIRYYWGHPAVARSLEVLLANLKPGLPAEWVKAYLPEVDAAPPAEQCPLDPTTLIRRRVQLALAPYFDACA